ncbi:MlaD family protein [Rhodococcus chondri]|uniref:MCE family protein n=1 Tax=Rhodococcus chondri TaxID=3065941 RepID=A0ABU7JVV0_9NOCA|nr:MCE family protein [Rhodococcus sp. CC-R104]MEE2033892.1 MCE family protein [Rhodococcus sp. CC-R104]
MSILLESDPNRLSTRRLFLCGVVALMSAALLVAATIAKTGGKFDEAYHLTALLGDIGDGLPAGSDVKFRGVLVGEVREVGLSTDGGPNVVRISIDPERLSAIPGSVTARVVPSNVFAVSSVQLVDNGAAAPLRENATIVQDESLSTVQLQTALTKLRELTAAAARLDTQDTLGVLAAVAEATDRRGKDIVQAGARLERIVHEIGAVVTPDGGPSTLSALADAVEGLHNSAPDLLDAVGHAVGPMRTLVETEEQLSSFFFGSANTLSTVATAFENNTEQMTSLTARLGPVLGVVADGAHEFTPIVTRMNRISEKWFVEFWPPGQQNGVGKFVFQATPHLTYTRADCPRYGDLAGPSCTTAPETGAPRVVDRLGESSSAGGVPVGGNVGPVGSPDEKKIIDRILGGDLGAAADLLLGPVARGADIRVVPEDSGAPR